MERDQEKSKKIPVVVTADVKSFYNTDFFFETRIFNKNLEFWSESWLLQNICGTINLCVLMQIQ